MGKEAEVVELLMCKCNDCRHWEIGKTPDGLGFLQCKTCNTTIPMSIIQQGEDTVLVLDDHHLLHWAKHER